MSVFFLCYYGDCFCIVLAKFFFGSAYYWGKLCNFANQKSTNHFKYYIYEKI